MRYAVKLWSKKNLKGRERQMLEHYYFHYNGSFVIDIEELVQRFQHMHIHIIDI